jgi:hypothetical protein
MGCQISAVDIKPGMVVEYQGQRIAVSAILPGIHVQTIADEGWVHMIRVPWKQTVIHLHDFQPRETR